MNNKKIFFILLLILNICINADDIINNDYFLQFLIYGEENSPDNIYYKYIRNHQSELFFYSLIECTDINNQDIIALKIIPNQGLEGVFLIYNINMNHLRQYSLVFYENVMLSHGIYPLYTASEELFIADAEYLYYFLLRQYDFNYVLSSKSILNELIDNIFPKNIIVYINKFSILDPGYIRE